MPSPAVTIEIWSDVVCPWCYIGKRRFEDALSRLDDTIEVDVKYRAYQLDPSAAPGACEPVIDAYARKFGGPQRAAALIERVTETARDEGLEFHMDIAKRANTLLAHRLIWLSEQPDSPIDQAAMKERLLAAYFTEGRHIGDPDVLADCAAEVGFERDVVAAFLAGDRGRDEVASQIAQAGELAITAVPTYVVNGQWSIPGAQDPTTFVNVIERLNERAIATATAADTCTDDACEV